MKKRTFKKLSALFAVFLFSCVLLFCFSGCGERAEETDTDTKISSHNRIKIEDYIRTYVPTTDISVETETAADGRYDYKNYKFTILNSESGDELYGFIDPDMTGGVLDDTCFERNLMAEEYFNVTVNEVTKPVGEIADHAKNTILSGEDIYDVMYIPIRQLTPMISEALFLDLLEIKELNINNIWWDQIMINQSIVGDRLFFATSDLNLTAMETAPCVFFNEDMMIELGFDLPLDTALSGLWTLDEMKKYASAAADPDGNTTFDIGNESIYGFLSTADRVKYLICGLEVSPVKRDDYGRYQFTASEDPKYTAAWSDIAEYLGSDGFDACIGNDEDIEEKFINGGSLFIEADVSFGRFMGERDKNILFGILPMPKSEISQESYISNYSPSISALCIPNTNTDTKRTGIIIDYLTYMSYVNLMPRYYDLAVSRKALSRTDSINVLALIRETKACDPSLTYGWDSGMTDALTFDIGADIFPIASVMDEYKERITSAINATYEGCPKPGMKE